MAALRNRKMGSVLNLVFDNWDDNGNPLPNLHFLNEKLNYEYLVLPDFIFKLNSEDLQINKCKLSDVNQYRNFYYVISHRCSLESIYKYNDENIWEIPTEVEECIRNKNLNIILLSEHESFKHIDVSIKELKNVIIKKGLNESQFYIINNSSMLEYAVSTSQSNINVHKINFLMDSVSSGMNIKISDSDFIEDKKFTFLCHNRRPKPHRLSILTHMKNMNLLQDDITDWSLTYGIHNNKLADINEFQTYVDFSNKKIFEDYKEICSKPKLSFYESDKNWFNHESDYDAWNHLELKSYQNSYINIITESHFDILDIHITEKSFKPFYYFQIPLFLASYNHISKMKEEYDLDFFDDLIDHSYDNEINDIKRLHLIISEIDRLSKLKDDIKLYYKSNKNRFISNHNFIKEYYHKGFAIQYFKNISNKKILNKKLI
jgi:hypothetical protein